jgi:peptidoglycan L-alanyl-D-glutamate endopeptidase CwlK
MIKSVVFICLVAVFLQSCAPYKGGTAQIEQNRPASAQPASAISQHTNSNNQGPNSVLIDSNLSLEEAIGHHVVPDQIKKELCLVEVEYYALDGKLHRGQLVIHNSLKEDVVNIFRELKENRFPVAKIIPVSRYDFSDDKSMEDNNTSAFNYRTIDGSKKLSNHALGRAIDINPLLNPEIKGISIRPHNAKYDPTVPGTITTDSFIVKNFKNRGWKWGGDWKQSKDYQHFEKPALIKPREAKATNGDRRL